MCSSVKRPGFHEAEVENLLKFVAYDPSKVSPASIARLAAAAAKLCAQVEGVNVSPRLAPEVVAKVLWASMLDVRRVLKEIGVPLPPVTGGDA